MDASVAVWVRCIIASRGDSPSRARRGDGEGEGQPQGLHLRLGPGAGLKPTPTGVFLTWRCQDTGSVALLGSQVLFDLGVDGVLFLPHFLIVDEAVQALEELSGSRCSRQSLSRSR